MSLCFALTGPTPPHPQLGVHQCVSPRGAGPPPCGQAGSLPHFCTRSHIPQRVPGAVHGGAKKTNRTLVSKLVVDLGECHTLTEICMLSSWGEDGGEEGGGVGKGFLEEVALSLQIPVPGTEQVPPLQLLTFRRDPLPSPRL